MLILETNKISLKPGTSLVVYMKIRALYSRYMFVCICVWKSYSVVLRGWKKPAGRVQGKSFWVGRDSAGHRWHWSGTGGCCRRWCSGGGMCHLRCSSNLFHGHNRAELVGMAHWVRFLRADPCFLDGRANGKAVCVCPLQSSVWRPCPHLTQVRRRGRQEQQWCYMGAEIAAVVTPAKQWSSKAAQFPSLSFPVCSIFSWPWEGLPSFLM